MTVTVHSRSGSVPSAILRRNQQPPQLPGLPLRSPRPSLVVIWPVSSGQFQTCRHRHRCRQARSLTGAVVGPRLGRHRSAPTFLPIWPPRLTAHGDRGRVEFELVVPNPASLSQDNLWSISADLLVCVARNNVCRYNHRANLAGPHRWSGLGCRYCPARPRRSISVPPLNQRQVTPVTSPATVLRKASG